MARRDYRDNQVTPPIRRVGQMSRTRSGAVDAHNLGLSSLLSAGSKAVDGMAQSDADLLIWLHRKLHNAKSARARAGWFGGRFYNRMVNEDPDYLDMSGVHLAQVLALIGFDAPPWVTAQGKYQLRYDLCEGAYAALRKASGLPPFQIGSAL